MSRKASFIGFIKFWGVLLFLGFGVVHIGYEALENYHSFNITSNRMKEDYIAQQKEKVKQEVERVVDLLNFKLSKGNNEETKKELLELISRIRFDKEGYIFVNSLDGNALVANGKILSGNKKLWEEFPSNPDKLKNLFNMEYDAAQKPNGDYIYYSFVKLNNLEKESPKVSFIYGIKDLQWLVGAGVYLDDVEEKIAELHDELKSQIVDRLLSSVLVIVSAIVLFLFLLNLFSKKLKNDIDQFYLFFKNITYKDIPIDLEKIKFREFENMAKNANKMLNDKVKVQQELFDEREQLFVTIRSVGDGLITTNDKGKVELMNRVAEKLTGWTFAEA
jgi:PAS domain-containing protein